MKIAVVRGPSLNQFEMQYYQPLAEKHEVVCFGSTQPVYDITSINLPVVKLPCWGQVIGGLPGATRALYWLFGDPQGLIGLENKLDGFEIAHTAELFSYYTHLALMARGKGKVKKVVATVSENIPFNQEQYPKQKALKKFALKNLDHILAISSLSKKAMVTEGYPKQKITVVPHGLNLEKFKPQKRDEKYAKKLGVKKDDLVILSVGRLVSEKGFADLLKAANELMKDKNSTGKNLRFLIVGGGPEKGKLVELRDSLGLSKQVVFGQSLLYDEMVRIYSLADIFVLASKPTPVWEEQFGMVLIEAMACGVPVIATKTGGIPETVGKAGILVSANDWLELREEVKKLILDTKLREGLSREGRERVKKQFDRMIIAKKIEKIYQKVLED